MANRYHFFEATQTSSGKHLLSLPNQKLGTRPVTPGILVKDAKGSTAVASARRRSAPGDILFTTTLRRNGHALVASDMHSLRDNEDILLQDARDEYEKLTSDKQ